jgi:hypothetical protein
MMKSVPNLISYLQEISQFFLTLYLFFLCEKLVSSIYEKGKALTCASKPSHAVCRLAAWGGTIHHAHGHKRPLRQHRKTTLLSSGKCSATAPLQTPCSPVPELRCPHVMLLHVQTTRAVTAAAVELAGAARSFLAFPPPNPW